MYDILKECSYALRETIELSPSRLDISAMWCFSRFSDNELQTPQEISHLPHFPSTQVALPTLPNPMAPTTISKTGKTSFEAPSPLQIALALAVGRSKPDGVSLKGKLHHSFNPKWAMW